MKTTKLKDQLYYNDYIFQHKRTANNGTITWRCKFWKQPQHCKATIKTSDDMKKITVVRDSHTHDVPQIGNIKNQNI